MVRRYKASVLAISADLRRLEEDLENLDLLRSLQGAITRRIKLAERRAKAAKEQTRRLKSKLRGERPPKKIASALRRQIAASEESLNAYRYLTFIWRCFGDGIAFMYLDKYALKHVYFDTVDYVVKQEPGSLSGKAGLAVEWSFVKYVLTHGVPALLCDLTNTLRHGDVCILVGPDPLLVEVKSSTNTNERIARQLESIGKLAGFFRDDEARNFRGTPHVVRTALSSTERNYFAEIGQCIKDSEVAGAATCEPEPGVRYACIRDPDVGTSLLSSVLSGSKIVATLLNDAKADRVWMPNYPFTLSIREPTSLFEFIRGQVSVLVTIDLEIVKEKFTELGFRVAFLPEGPWAFWIRSDDGEFTAAISRPLFNRVFFEFQSLDWFVREQGARSNGVRSDLDAQPTPNSIDEPVKLGWLGPHPDVEAVFRDFAL
ncbi:hypothetical protein PE066_14500 [Ramlibacter tataouinensis]|uniref:hypothetical protein n=1 Tax=Ramlibacter tataouinensis TaxID=94132 RepID=UPI0022F3F97B|nr:hypothetical protein [Ramlibacter tataouinensis]WBY00670.1 hypothetical protein PE066_14500 [Ramlibacter tataouinensis]